METYRILLADDHILFREAVSKAIQRTEGLAVIEEVGDGLELIAALEKSVPDLIILDLNMPNLSGLEAAKKIKQINSTIKILILTMHNSLNHLKRALAVGINGYLLKEDAFQDLVSAIGIIRGGWTFISPRLSGQFMEFYYTHHNPKDILTKQERKVLALIAQYKDNEEIIQDLSISNRTLGNHIGSIKKKLDIGSRPHLIKYGREAGYDGVI
jgi:two-component system, NarL family, response regulator DegU